MVKIRNKFFIFLFVFFLLIKFVYATNVCVVVQYPDSTSNVECVDVNDNANGYDVLEATNFDLLWTPESFYGKLLCKINGIGDNIQGQYCEYNGNFWNFNLLDNGEYKHSPVGFDGGDACWNRDFDFSDWSLIVHYCAKDGDVLGFSYGSGVSPEMLKINEIIFYVDNDEKSGTIKAEPGSELKIKVDMKNLYPDDSNIEIQNILVSGTINGIDDGEDLEEESEEIDLKAGKSKKAELSFKIHLEVEEDDYDLELKIEAEDTLGVKYLTNKEYKIEVNKKTHEIIFYNAEIADAELECDRETSANIGLINIGTKDEDVSLEIVNNDLGLNIEKKLFLSEETFSDQNKYSGLVPIKISEESKAGSYQINVKAVYNKGALEEKKTLNLELRDCKKEVAEELSKAEEVKPADTEMEVVTGTVIYDEKKTDYKPLLLGLVIAFSILAVISLIALFLMK